MTCYKGGGANVLVGGTVRLYLFPHFTDIDRLNFSNAIRLTQTPKWCRFAFRAAMGNYDC